MLVISHGRRCMKLDRIDIESVTIWCRREKRYGEGDTKNDRYRACTRTIERMCVRVRVRIYDRSFWRVRCKT